MATFNWFHSIKLLQLSNIELTEFIENAQLENPFLKEKVGTNEISQSNNAEKDTPDICENLNNTSDPLHNDSITELQNTFDSHVSYILKSENKKLYEKEVINKGNLISAGEVIEKTTENKISLRDHLIAIKRINFKSKIDKAIANGDQKSISSQWMAFNAYF